MGFDCLDFFIIYLFFWLYEGDKERKVFSNIKKNTARIE